MTLHEIGKAVRATGRGFRVDGEKLLLTPVDLMTSPLPPGLADEIRHHKPQLMAALKHPLVAHAMKLFAVPAASIAGAEIDVDFLPARRRGVKQKNTAPTPTAASTRRA